MPVELVDRENDLRDARSLLDQRSVVVVAGASGIGKTAFSDALATEHAKKGGGSLGGDTITFAPNTHELVLRIFSCLEPPVRILTTDSDFHSFNRQSRRWEEAGLAIIDRVAAEPFDTFSERFTREARAGVHDLIFLSEVFQDRGFYLAGGYKYTMSGEGVCFLH